MSLGGCVQGCCGRRKDATPPLDQLSTHGYSEASAIPKTERRVFQTAVVSTRSSERRPFLSRDWCFLLRSIRALINRPRGRATYLKVTTCTHPTGEVRDLDAIRIASARGREPLDGRYCQLPAEIQSAHGKTKQARHPQWSCCGSTSPSQPGMRKP